MPNRASPARAGSVARQASSGPPPSIVGPAWASTRLRQPGWLLLPLRGFLAVTFVFAALQKFANPAYLNPHSPASVAAQMHALRHISPIGPLLGLSLHAPVLVGLLIATGELAVGIGALLGLWTRVAALGGMALSLTFFLTVSWSTTPYYYGADIVFFFAWTVFAAIGAGGVLSLDGMIHDRARRAVGLGATPAVAQLEVPTLRRLCNETRRCGIRADGICHVTAGCPLRQPAARVQSAAEVERRAVLLGARWVGLTAVAAGLAAAFTAGIGRLLNTGSAASTPDTLPRPTARSGGTSTTKPSRKPSRGARPQGTVIGRAAAVPVGQAGRFTDPHSGDPAYVVRPAAGEYVAFSAVCTHAGCIVGFDSSTMEFICPCHGGTYNAKTGAVTGGPPPSSLPRIPLTVSNGQLVVN